MLPVSQISEVNQADRTGAHFDVGHRKFAALDAVEPVAVVAGGFEEVDLFFAERLSDEVDGVTSEDAAIEVERAAFAMKNAATGAAVDDFNSIGESIAHAALGFFIGGRNDLDGAGVVEV